MPARVLVCCMVALAMGGAAWCAPGVGEVQGQAVSTEPEGSMGLLLHQKIDINLIDLDELREVIEGQQGPERLRLSLDECVRIAVASNPDIRVVSYEPLKSDADIYAAKGEFDPLLSAMTTYRESEQRATPEYRTFGGISSITEERRNSTFTLGGKLGWGTTYDATFTVNWEETTFNRFVRQWSGGLALTLTQPLLRGRGKAANLARIRIAKNSRVISDLQVELAVMNAIGETIKAYWDLVGAVENLTVMEQALANAERLLDISRKQLDIGTGAAIDVVQAKAGVATRQSELISARSSVADAEDMLKQLLDMRDNGVFSSRRIAPTDRPSVAEFSASLLQDSEAELAASIEASLANRPEIASDELTIENAKVERKRAANDMLPQLDVSGTVFQGGRDLVMDGVFDGVRDRSDNSYGVTVQGSIPLGNRAARGAHQSAEMTLRQAEQRLEKTKQEAMLRVRLAMRARHTSHILVESNRQARVLQETNVIAEEKRLRLGTSTSYRVLQIQEDLTRARTQEVQARVNYEKAMADLRLAEGTLLDNLDIEFAPPEREKPVEYLKSLVPPELVAIKEHLRAKRSKKEKAPPDGEEAP